MCPGGQTECRESRTGGVTKFGELRTVDRARRRAWGEGAPSALQIPAGSPRSRARGAARGLAARHLYRRLGWDRSRANGHGPGSSPPGEGGGCGGVASRCRGPHGSRRRDPGRLARWRGFAGDQPVPRRCLAIVWLGMRSSVKSDLCEDACLHRAAVAFGRWAGRWGVEYMIRV